MKMLATHMLILSLFAPLPAIAWSDPSPPPFEAKPQAPVERPTTGNYVGEPGISAEILTEGFLSAHPDLRWRREGLHHSANGRHEEAMAHFLRAARYADKPAQAMIAEMYWKGLGVPQDRALAYAWMDLAAERFYSNFLIKREHYWESLDAAEQADAIERGQPLLEEYGDEVAKPRMAQVLRRNRGVTGSRLGFVGNLEIIPFTGPNAGSGLKIRADEYYAAKYWKPDKYFEWQDQMWNAPPPRKGRVKVGDVEGVAKAGDEDE
jgi:hypothetical protein